MLYWDHFIKVTLKQLQLLSMKNVPVISPLSKDVGNPMLIYTRPYQQMK
jgi:hypothetical protein